MRLRECPVCGKGLEPQKRGRPRKFCTDCVPPGQGKEATRAWRAVNPDRVAAYNGTRRLEPVYLRWKDCLACGARFYSVRKDALTCSRRCQRQRREVPV